jgi:hypothetical protein
LVEDTINREKPQMGGISMKSHRISLIMALVGISCFGLTHSSCNQPTDDSNQKSPAQTTRAGAHAVHAASLQQVMGKLDRQVAKTWPQEIQEEQEALSRKQKEAQFRKAGQLALALSQAGDDIGESVSNVQMSAAERKAFDALLRQMKFQAAELKSAAKVQNRESMQTILGRIKTTCCDCHQQFSGYVPKISCP